MLRPLLASLIAGAALLLAAEARAQLAIDIDVFQDRLSPYGRWIDYRDYGRVWTPYRHDWRPYSEGRWVYTDEYGWLWVEDDDWGWATEHYGRWLFDDAIGWLWVPGFEWAPAWVSWRSGSDYIGWAPLAPSRWRHRHHDDWERRRWRFVRGDRFLSRDLHTVLVEPSRTHWLIERVPERGRVRKAHGRWENRAFDREFIERVTREPVQRVRVEHAERAQRARVDRDAVAVFRPELRSHDQRSKTATRERDRHEERARKPETRPDAKAASPSRGQHREPSRAPQAHERKAAPPPRASRTPERAERAPQQDQRRSVERRTRQPERPQATSRDEQRRSPPDANEAKPSHGKRGGDDRRSQAEGGRGHEGRGRN